MSWSWSKLPSPLLGVVFGFLTQSKILTCAHLVCAKWKQTRALWSHLAFEDVTDNNQAATLLKACENKQILEATFKDTNYLSLYVSILPNLQRLKFISELKSSHMDLLLALTMRRVQEQENQHEPWKLAFKLHYGITSNDFRHYVSIFSGIEHLSLKWCDFQEQELRYLHQLHFLKSLALPHTCKDADLLALKELCSLVELDVSRSELMTYRGLAHLTQFPALRRLKLPRDVTPRGLVYLRALKLESLTFAEFTVVDKELGIELAELKTLRHLRLILSEECLKHLRGLPNLEHLRINKNNFFRYTGNFTAYLKDFRALRTLDVEFHYSELFLLQGLNQVTRLVLRGKPNFWFLSEVAALKELVVNSGGEITDVDLDCFGNLTGLRLLDLTQCEKVCVSEIGLSHLSRLTDLECLGLPKATQNIAKQ
jgi:hypothetical protein